MSTSPVRDDALARTLDLPDAAQPQLNAARYRPWLADLTSRTMLAIDAGQPNPDLLLDPHVAPGVAAWMGLRKHAVALHPLYCVPDLRTLGAGLALADLDEPLLDGMAPFELLARFVGSEASARIRVRYQAFLEQEVTDPLRITMSFTLDARQIRWRANAAAVLAREAAHQWAHELVIVSLACGAAGPVARLADGHEVASMYLIDRDPVALAVGRAIARQHLDASKLHIELLDLVNMEDGTATSLAPHIREPAHIVDILGLFEYLPDDTAISLLKEARAVLRPDGVILLANMLRERPEQDVFSHLIQWPTLIQRSIEDLVGLIRAAGFDLSTVTIATASPAEAVYAVAAIRV
jgi:SAM-dependent methyltransferase